MFKPACFNLALKHQLENKNSSIKHALLSISSIFPSVRFPWTREILQMTAAMTAPPVTLTVFLKTFLFARWFDHPSLP
jgi:hypothetical protein